MLNKLENVCRQCNYVRRACTAAIMSGTHWPFTSFREMRTSFFTSADTTPEASGLRPWTLGQVPPGPEVREACRDPEHGRRQDKLEKFKICLKYEKRWTQTCFPVEPGTGGIASCPIRHLDSAKIATGVCRAIAGTPLAFPSFVLVQASCRTVAGGGKISYSRCDWQWSGESTSRPGDERRPFRQMPSSTRSERDKLEAKKSAYLAWARARSVYSAAHLTNIWDRCSAWCAPSEHRSKKGLAWFLVEDSRTRYQYNIDESSMNLLSMGINNAKWQSMDFYENEVTSKASSACVKGRLGKRCSTELITHTTQESNAINVAFRAKNLASSPWSARRNGAEAISNRFS